MIEKTLQYYKFCAYGFLKNLRFFDAFLLLFFREKGLTYFEIGILYSIREFSTLLLEIPTGIISDITGRRKTLLLSFLSYIFSFLIFYFTSEFWIFATAMIFFAFGEAFRTGTHKAMIFDYLKIRNISHLKTEYYGHTRSWSQFGSAVSSLLAGFLIIINGNYQIIFLASVFPYILNFINLASYPKELEGTQILSKKIDIQKDIKEISRLFKNQPFTRRISSSAIYAGLLDAIEDYLQPVIKSTILLIPIGYSISTDNKSTILISIIYFLMYISTSFASKNAAKFSGEFDNIAKAIDFSLIWGLVSSLMVGITFSFRWGYVTIIIFFILHIIENIRRPMNISFISESLNDKYLSTGLSIESQYKTLVTAILAPIIGKLADVFGIGLAIFSVSLILLLIYPIVKTNKN